MTDGTPYFVRISHSPDGMICFGKSNLCIMQAAFLANSMAGYAGLETVVVLGKPSKVEVTKSWWRPPKVTLIPPSVSISVENKPGPFLIDGEAIIDSADMAKSLSIALWSVVQHVARSREQKIETTDCWSRALLALYT